MITLSALGTRRTVNKYYLLLTATFAGLSVGLIARCGASLSSGNPAATLREPRPKCDKTEKKIEKNIYGWTPSVQESQEQ